jgi:hypothetical protein
LITPIFFKTRGCLLTPPGLKGNAGVNDYPPLKDYAHRGNNGLKNFLCRPLNPIAHKTHRVKECDLTLNFNEPLFNIPLINGRAVL